MFEVDPDELVRRSSSSSATASPDRVSTAPDRRTDLVEAGRELLAVDRGERHRPPPLGAGGRRREVVRPNQPTSRHSSGWRSSSPPIAVHWNTSMYIPKREKPIRWPSITDSTRSGTHSMPVSSGTSFTATSAGE